MLNEFTSTGAKYNRHPEMINALRNGHGRPASLQVSLTNKCNLACQFCSTDERERDQEWDLSELIQAIRMFKIIGIGTIEFSGGGDPTMYRFLPEIVEFCKGENFKLGMITNGIRLKDLPIKTLEAFDWIRVSMITIDYLKNLELPQPWPKATVLGMSYVVGQINYNGTIRKANDSDYEGLKIVKEYALRYGAQYCRVVPDCYTPNEEEMNKVHAEWRPIVEKLGHPLFFQGKFQLQAKKCFMDATKPWLDTSGFVFPCNSVTLCTQADRKFDMKWALCHWREARVYYAHRGSHSLPFVEKLCDRCTFTTQNEILEDLIIPMMHEEFV